MIALRSEQVRPGDCDCRIACECFEAVYDLYVIHEWQQHDLDTTPLHKLSLRDGATLTHGTDSRRATSASTDRAGAPQQAPSPTSSLPGGGANHFNSTERTA